MTHKKGTLLSVVYVFDLSQQFFELDKK